MLVHCSALINKSYIGWGVAPPSPALCGLWLLLEHNGQLVVGALQENRGGIGDNPLLLGALESASQSLKNVLRLIKQLAKQNLGSEEEEG